MNSVTHNSFVSPCIPHLKYANNDEFFEDNFIEELEDDKKEEVRDCEDSVSPCYTKFHPQNDLVIVQKVQRPLLQSPKNTVNYNVLSYTDSLVERKSAIDTESISLVKTLMIQSQTRNSFSLVSSPTSLADENKNCVLLVKTPTSYLPLTPAASKQPQQQKHQLRIQQQSADYHYNQQNDQRKVLNKLFLPNKIHVIPFHHPYQKQQQIATSNSNAGHKDRLNLKNIASKIKVLNLRKRLATPTTNH